MAAITSLISGSPLCGSPVVYQVKADYHPSAVFHRVKLQVVAGLQHGNYTIIEMSSPATDKKSAGLIGSGELLKFDISSALQAVADQYEYTVNPPEYYPYIQYYLIAWDEYMINGVSHTSTKDYFPDNCAPGSEEESTPMRALFGAYSDMDRLLSAETKQTQHFTRKPTSSPELVLVGDEYIRPSDMVVHVGNIEHGPQSARYKIISRGTQQVGNVQVYAVTPVHKLHYTIRFINGFGCMESVVVQSYKKSTVAVGVNLVTKAVQEMFNSFSRGIAVKQNDFEKWKLSSGPLDEQWASWFVHEFLMAQWAWINVRTVSEPLWIPCHIVPDDDFTITDSNKSGLIEVSFTIQFDITGSPLYQLSV